MWASFTRRCLKQHASFRLDFGQFSRTLYIRLILIEKIARPSADYGTNSLKLRETTPDSDACTKMAKVQFGISKGRPNTQDLEAVEVFAAVGFCFTLAL
jgi:hypothetical protein